MATIFETLIQNLESVGFFRYFLPFVFMLAVVYGLLRRIEVFEDQQVDATVATAVAFIAMLGVYTFDLAGIMIQFFGALTVGIVLLLGLVLILGMFGVEVQELDNHPAAIGAGVIVFALVIVGVMQAIPGQEGFISVLTGEAAMTLYTIVGLIAVIGFITRE